MTPPSGENMIRELYTRRGHGLGFVPKRDETAVSCRPTAPQFGAPVELHGKEHFGHDGDRLHLARETCQCASFEVRWLAVRRLGS
jgi:hypothetical protein